MFERVENLQIPTPYPQVDSPIARIDYYMTPITPTCERPGYPEGDIVQVAARITYENEEQWYKILPISFSALKQLIVEAEHVATCSIGTEIADTIRPIERQSYATPSS